MWFRNQIVAAARSCLNTPFHHQGRVKGVGIDCMGLLVCIAKDLGMPYHDFEGYGRQPRPDTLSRQLAIDLAAVPKEQARIGDIVSFWIVRKGIAQHTGVLTNIGLIHTYADVGRVVEHSLNMYWSERVVGVYRCPDVSDVNVPLFPWPTPEAEIPPNYKPNSQEPCCG